MAIVKELFSEKLWVRIFENRNDMGAAAAYDAGVLLKRILQEKPEANVMFAAAPSQNEVLKALSAIEDIGWDRVNAFHLDEYVGLDPNHPAGFRNFLRRTIFNRHTFKSIHLLDGNADDPEQEARAYGRLLSEHPIDICLMGIGENGHIAFNDPHVADFTDPVLVKVVELEESSRQQQVNDGCFRSLDEVPQKALSVTITGIISSGALLCSVPAATKAKAVYHAVFGPVSIACPATIMRSHPDARLYLDADSGQHILQRCSE